MDGAAGMSKILLVEGQNDMHVVNSLRGQKLPGLSFGIKNSKGVDKLLKAVRPEIKAPGRAAVGFVLDANDDPVGRWRDISDRLREADICAPRDEEPCPKGTIKDGVPRVGVWLMPDNQSSGELEDFVRSMIPEDDLAWKLAQRYIQNIPKEERKFRPRKKGKAEVHAWTAARKDPGMMGLAIDSGDLKTDGPLCTAFLEWLKTLFA